MASKNEGKKFEANIKNSIPDTVYYVRIKDSALAFGMDKDEEGKTKGVTKFTPNNPYDSFMFYKGYLFPLELKSTKSTSISIQKTKKEKGKMIKTNQIEGLTYAGNFEDVYAGFLFDFRKSDKTYYLDIHDFNKFAKDNPHKKSINEKEIMQYNGFIIDKVMKIKYYKYRIGKMIKEIVKRS